MEESPSEAEKARIYRAYSSGELTRLETRERFGADVEEFEAFDSLMTVVHTTPTNEPTDELFS